MTILMLVTANQIKHDFITCHALSWIQALKWNAQSSGLHVLHTQGFSSENFFIVA
jgi:hypothetical protein